MEESKALTTAPVNDSPAAMMFQAVQSGMDIAKLEKFMELQERWQANEARKAYTEAMSAFKANPPKIEKDSHVSYKTASGTTEYSHASLGNVTDTIGAALGKHGLSAAWGTMVQGEDSGRKATKGH